MEKIILISISEATIKNIVEDAVKQALHESKVKLSSNQNVKRILTFAEGCAYAGFSKSHGYKLTSQGKIPHSKRGKRIYFEKDVLDDWLLANKVKDTSQLLDEADNYLQQRRRKRS